MDTDNIFAQLAFILTLATIFGFLVRKVNLPLIVAYLLVGVLISLATIFNFQTSAVALLPEIGIAFVLFLIGMELDLRELHSLGKQILAAGILQITISSLAGFIIANLFGYHHLEAIYLGVGLSFSSTVVVVKMLLEKKDLSSLYGKMAVGITLLEDLVAVVILMFLSVSHPSVGATFLANSPIFDFVIKGSCLLILTFIVSRYLLNSIFKAVAKSPELLFLTALTWCFLFITIALWVGFSVVIGAFLAGVALAASPFHYHIGSRIKPLRDFFIILFFVYLGSQVGLDKAFHHLDLIVVFVVYSVVFKPLVFLLVLGAFGFRKHTIFQAALSLSSISEFSLIITLFGIRYGVISQELLSVMALTVTLSIILSSISITYSRQLYLIFRPFLGFFEQKGNLFKAEKRQEHNLEDHVVIIGAGRIGGPVVDYLNEAKIPFIVLDINPDTVEALTKRGVTAIYGDLGDTEVLEHLKLDKTKLIISTAQNVDDNLVLLSEMKRQRLSAKVVMRAQDDEEEALFKRKGADYIILPEAVSADFLVNQLKTHWPKIYFKLD